MSIFEYNEEKHMQQVREEGMEDGYLKSEQNIIFRMLDKCVSDEDILEFTGITEEQLKKIKQERNKV